MRVKRRQTTTLLTKLAGGDLRSMGLADQVAADVLASPALIGELGLKHESLRSPAEAALGEALRTGPPSLKARARILTKRYSLTPD